MKCQVCNANLEQCPEAGDWFCPECAMNLDKLECCMCEGIFSTGEEVIEVGGVLYCEACYETESDTGEIY